MQRTIRHALITFTFATAVTHGLGAQKTNPFPGTWRIAEVQTAEGAMRPNPVPSLWIFTRTHYSVTFYQSTQTATSMATTKNPTTDSAKARLWEVLRAHAGTYETDGKEVTVHPQVSKVPEAMQPGGDIIYSYMRNGDTLWLTDRNRSRAKLIRVE